MANANSLAPQIALITLGVSDPVAAKAFYREGFGWEPVFEMEDIAFFQLNGFVFGLWDRKQLEEDMGTPCVAAGAIALAHNVESAEAVDEAMEKLIAAGATLLRKADAPPHGGYRGYVADPDGHAWEIAWNPTWEISEENHVTIPV